MQVHLTTSRGVQRGNLEIQLTSPDGTESVLLTRRSSDYSQDGLDWTFMTLKCWGERPVGQWHLSIFHDSGVGGGVYGPYGAKKSKLIIAVVNSQVRRTCYLGHLFCMGTRRVQGSLWHVHGINFKIRWMGRASLAMQSVMVVPVGFAAYLSFLPTIFDLILGATSLGPTERDCSKCAHVSFGPACVESCTALSLTETPNKTCVRCHTSCDNSGCSGDLPSECQWCKTVQLDRDCVEACPSYYFLSSNKT